MDPLNPFANAWQDDKPPQNDTDNAHNDAFPAWNTNTSASNIPDGVTGSHALPSWSQPDYEQDTSSRHVDTYASESPAWRPASPVWQASSSPDFDKEEANTPEAERDTTAEAYPITASTVTEPATADDDDWGQMALPKSRWEEELHKPPVWEPEESKGKEESDDMSRDISGTPSMDANGEWPSQDLNNEDDPWGGKTYKSAINDGTVATEEQPASERYGYTGEDKAVIDSRYHGGTPPESPSSSSFAGRDFAPVKPSDIERRQRAKDVLEASRSSNTSAEDEDALRVLAELGIPVRNLDQEEEKDNAAKPAASTSRWSIFGGRRITPTAAQLESSRASIEAGAGQAAAKMSASMDVIREKAASVSLPRLSSSSAAAASSPADTSTSRTGTPPLTPGETAASSTAPGFAQKESKWFRFGAAKKPAVASPTTSDPRPASAGSNTAPSSSTPTTTISSVPATKTQIDILDDFGQLENFDSRLPAPTAGPINPSTTNLKSSLSSYHRDDLVIDKPSWSFWSGRAASASHSALGKSGIVEHANDGEAELDNIFEAFEAAPKKTVSGGTGRGNGLFFDGSSQKTREVAPDLVGLEDPYSVLGVGSSRTAPSKRISSAKDLDPLDPLAAFVSSQPAAKPTSRIPSGPVSPLAPPPALSSSISRPQSANSTVRPLAPPPRLAPPPPSAGLRKTPSPTSLIDDFGDFAVSPTASAAQSSSTTPHPSASTASVSTSSNDDFGDFEAFAISASSTTPASTAKPTAASPKKAVGPMKLAPQKPILGGAGAILSQQDLSFFDSL